MFNKFNDILKGKDECEKEERHEDDILSVFNTPQGCIALYTISLHFGDGSVSFCTLHLEYTDSINFKLYDIE